jgi:hypothetical protein
MTVSCPAAEASEQRSQWDELNAQWQPFRRGENLYVVPRGAKLRAIALPPTAIVQYEPIETPKDGTRA